MGVAAGAQACAVLKRRQYQRSVLLRLLNALGCGLRRTRLQPTHRGAPISLILLLALIAAALLARGLAVVPLVGIFRAATALIGGLGRRYAHRRRPWRHLHAL